MALNSLDAAVFTFLNRDLNIPPLNPVMVFVTDHNPYLFLALFLVFWRLEGTRSFMVLALALAAFGLADLAGGLLKHLFMRPRPCTTLQHVILLVKCSKGFSMPSNHSANSFAIALPFVLLGKNRMRYAFLFLAALVAYSRVYVGVHYPSDILAGALMGALMGLFMALLYRSAFPRKAREEEKQQANEGESPPDVP